MNMEHQLLAFGASLAACFILTWIFSSKRRQTIQGFFWGDQKIKPSITANLISTSSFSLNGLLYQTWLGYNIGWWSLLIQLIWCAGFVVLLANVSRFKHVLSVGTMHGIIGERLGSSASIVAGMASFLGFAILIGWEAVVGSFVVANVTGNLSGSSEIAKVSSVVLPALVLLVAALYTSFGGLGGNALINLGQNIFKITILIVAALALLCFSPLGAGHAVFASSGATKDLLASLNFLGGWALAANLCFSFFWQSVDMSNWQNLSATYSESSKGYKTTIIIAAILVFLFPGAIGSIIGVVLSDYASLNGNTTDTNILNQVIAALAAYPWIGLALMAAYGASMLSTIDGYSLAASQSAVWDVIRRKTVGRLLSEGSDRTPTSDDDKIIALSRLLVFAVAIIGGGAVLSLVQNGVNLFDLVYFVVIAQMTLVGPVALCIFDGNGRTQSGHYIILISLIVGYGAIIIARTLGYDALYTFSPVLTVAVSIFASAFFMSKARLIK